MNQYSIRGIITLLLIWPTVTWSNPTLAAAALTEYPGAAHGYDNPAVKTRFVFPQAPTLHQCSLIEGEVGQVLNARTGQPFTTGDPCMEWGTSLQYDEAATMSTREAVRAALTATLAAEPADSPAAGVKSPSKQ